MVIDKESDQTPGGQRDEGEVGNSQLGIGNAGFGLENNRSHDDKQYEKYREDDIPKVLISNAYHNELTRPHPYDQNEQ